MSLLYVDEPDKGSCSPRNSSEGSDKIAHRFCPEEDAPAVNSELVGCLCQQLYCQQLCWMKHAQPGSQRSTSPPVACFASCFVYGKAYSLVFEFLSITSSLGKSDYRDNLLNSEEFQFVSIEFCQFRIPDTFVFQSIDWSLPARRSGICFHSLRNQER